MFFSAISMQVLRLLCRSLIFILVFMLVGLASSPAVYCKDTKQYLMRNMATSLVLPQKYLEASFDYMFMNDSVDIFDIKDNNVSSAEFESLGDMSGGSINLNYGLFSQTTIHAEYAQRSLDYGYQDLDTDSFELSMRQNLNNEPRSSWPYFAFDLGYRFNRADDQSVSKPGFFNLLGKKLFNENLSVDYDSQSIEISGDAVPGGGKVSLPRNGGPKPSVEIQNLKDQTFFIRLITGRPIGSFYPNFFLEYGYTDIKGKIDSSLTYYEDKYKIDLQDSYPIPVDLDRDESYLGIGFSAMARLPLNLLLQMEYEYKRFFRDSDVKGVDYNHILEGNLSYPLTESLFINLGGKYLHRQYNGVLPFLYQKFTKSTFDNQYAEAHLGFTYVFNFN